MRKEAYFYWGNSSMSFLRYMTIKSFQYYNPDWKITLIRKTPMFDKNEDNYLLYLENINIIYLNDYAPEINITYRDEYIDDILTWKILSEKDVLKLDMDILFIKSVPKDFGKDVQLPVFDYESHYAIGMMFGKDKKFFKLLYLTAINNNSSGNYQYYGANLYKTAIFNIQSHGKINTTRMDNDLIYPYVKRYPWTTALDRPFTHTEKLPETTFGIHWYGGHTTSKRFDNLLTHNNYKNFKNTITLHIDKVQNESGNP